MKYNKTFRFIIIPSIEQQSTFSCTRLVYNLTLGKAREIYEAKRINKIITPASISILEGSG